MDMLPKSIVPDDLLKEMGDGLYAILETQANLKARIISQELKGEDTSLIRGGLEEIDNILFQVNKGFRQINTYIGTRAAQVSYVWQPKVINSQEAP